VVRLDSTRAGLSRDPFITHLKSKYQVGTAIHYPAVWTWEAFCEIDHDPSGCPIAERASREVVSLPVFVQSSKEGLEYVAWAVKETIAELSGSEPSPTGRR
jgi:dTDP-4-amino-4,6-dideoxygalactose transaminase